MYVKIILHLVNIYTCNGLFSDLFEQLWYFKFFQLDKDHETIFYHGDDVAAAAPVKVDSDDDDSFYEVEVKTIAGYSANFLE